jgi:GntR family transcriptional regulator/MocR family aminotransferase
MPVEELLVMVDRTLPVAAHTQLESGLRDAIRDGRLAGGGAVPPTRRLAEQLGVARGVVVEAYQQLTAEGYLVSRVGGYTRVADGVAAARPGPKPDHPPESPIDGRIDLTYGRPDVSQFPRSVWLKSMRKILTAMPHERLNYLDGRGAIELRQVLSDYLARVRGTWIEPANIVVTTGFAQALGLVLPALAARGIHQVAVEDPSDRDGQALARSLGLAVIGIPVAPDGIDVAMLAASNARAVIVTPAHQFPTGAVLSPGKRAELVAWARRVDGIIIEDDYDAEYRYDLSPVGSIQGLAPDHVIYAGTASKTLAPGLRLGWLAAPSRFVEDLATRKIVVDRGSPVLEQLTFADFIASGEFHRHLRRMRGVYRQRRDRLIAAMADQLPDLEPTGIAAGIHCFVPLPSDLDEQAILSAASRQGLNVQGVSDYRVQPAVAGALIIGYGKLEEAMIAEAVRRLASAVRQVRSATKRSPVGDPH